MRTLHVVRSSNSEPAWQGWIDALSFSRFRVREIEPARIERLAEEVEPTDAVLMDGLMPHLADRIAELHGKRPWLVIIVATENPSFAVYYEVLVQTGQVFYISESASPASFVSTVEEIVEAERSRGKELLPRWV